MTKVEILIEEKDGYYWATTRQEGSKTLYLSLLPDRESERVSWTEAADWNHTAKGKSIEDLKSIVNHIYKGRPVEVVFIEP